MFIQCLDCQDNAGIRVGGLGANIYRQSLKIAIGSYLAAQSSPDSIGQGNGYPWCIGVAMANGQFKRQAFLKAQATVRILISTAETAYAIRQCKWLVRVPVPGIKPF